MNTLLGHSLIYGLLLSLCASVLLVVTAYLNPESMVNDYPPDIRARFGPMSEKARRHRRLAGIPLAVVMLGVLVASIVTLPEITFFTVFVNTFVVLMTFNVVDLLVVDWLLINTIQPRFVVLPGTEGMAGYHNYTFHFRQFLKGTAAMLVMSLLLAAIAVLLDQLVGQR